MTLLTFLLGLIALSIGLFCIMAIAWLVWRATRNSGWVDTIWTFGLGFTGLMAGLTASTSLGYLVAAMAALWSLRLGSHIAFRTHGITDDPRYAKLIRDWGTDASRQMFWLLQKQAIVSIPLAAAMWLAANNPAAAPTIQIIVALAIFAIAVGGEALADEQLRQFRRNPANKGKVCDAGLWGWSRHPNYFFEWLGWLAYPVLAIDLSGAYPWGFLALAAPLCMYWLLVYISGIPPLEEHMLANRGDAFRSYQRRTNEFFPWPPKQPAGG